MHGLGEIVEVANPRRAHLSSSRIGLCALLVGFVSLACEAAQVSVPESPTSGGAVDAGPTTERRAGDLTRPCGPARNGISCDDGDPCTTDDRCDRTLCRGAPTACYEAPACRQIQCDDEACSWVDRPDGAPCDEGRGCVLEAECRAGACVAVRLAECPVGPCMLSNACNPGSGRCQPRYAESGAPCSDGSVCTEGERCQPVTGAPHQLSCEGGERVESSEPRCDHGICFTDVTLEAGIDFVASGFGPSMLGAGAVWADLDGDDWPDLVLASESSAPRFYRNERNGSFSDQTPGSGLDGIDGIVFQAFAAGDFDGDGDLDLYVTARGPNVLLENRGDGTFADVTERAGVGDERWSSGAMFGDADGDGDLDLLVGNYIAKQGSAYPNHIAMPNALYVNRGDGTFVDRAADARLGGASGAPDDPAGATLVVAFTDFDRDGDADVLECNDFGPSVLPNQLYENDGRGGFRRVGSELGAEASVLCMTIASGDWDRDGRFDYFHSSIGPHALLTQRDHGFVDVAAATGTEIAVDSCRPEDKHAGWGAVFEDFDADGWLDLFVVSGFITAVEDIANPAEQENRLLRNTGWGHFVDVSRSAGVASPRRGRGLVANDYDRDGDVDLLVMNIVGPPELLRNDSPSGARTLVVELQGRASNPFAPNALVEVQIQEGTKVVELVREYGVRPGFASSSPTELVFGLGEAPLARQVTVRWPSGRSSRAYDARRGQRLVLIEPRVTVEALDFTDSPDGDLTPLLSLYNHSASQVDVEITVRGDPEASPILSARRTAPPGASAWELYLAPHELEASSLFVVTDEGGGQDSVSWPASR